MSQNSVNTTQHSVLRDAKVLYPDLASMYQNLFINVVILYFTVTLLSCGICTRISPKVDSVIELYFANHRDRIQLGPHSCFGEATVTDKKQLAR